MLQFCIVLGVMAAARYHTYMSFHNCVCAPHAGLHITHISSHLPRYAEHCTMLLLEIVLGVVAVSCLCTYSLLCVCVSSRVTVYSCHGLLISYLFSRVVLNTAQRCGLILCWEWWRSRGLAFIHIFILVRVRLGPGYRLLVSWLTHVSSHLPRYAEHCTTLWLEIVLGVVAAARSRACTPLPPCARAPRAGLRGLLEPIQYARSVKSGVQSRGQRSTLALASPLIWCCAHPRFGSWPTYCIEFVTCH